KHRLVTPVAQSDFAAAGVIPIVEKRVFQSCATGIIFVEAIHRQVELESFRAVRDFKTGSAGIDDEFLAVGGLVRSGVPLGGGGIRPITVAVGIHEQPCRL